MASANPTAAFPHSPDLARAWRVLASIHGDTSCTCPETGEVWQYMGAEDGEHVFRHRSLNGQRVYERVAVAMDWRPHEPYRRSKEAA